jgi:type II secretory pathway component PulM
MTSPLHAKIGLILLILVAALGLWFVQRARIGRLRAALAEARMQQARLDEHTAALATDLESSRAELRLAHANRSRIETDVTALEEQLAKTDPEARWAVPPATQPDWNAESPYVWLRKDKLPRLPVSVFMEDGEINPDVALVLTEDASQQRKLNATLSRLLSDYRALEAAQARRTDDHLPGIAGQDGLKETIQVDPMPEEGKQIQQQFESALTETLGQQRANLLMQTGSSWLYSQFSQNGTQPKTISVIRHPNGTYNVSIQTAGNWMSTGGPASVVTNQIPGYLLPLFSDVLTPADDQAQQ